MKKIEHTRGLLRFTRKDILERMEARYVLPESESYLYYDGNKDIAFVQRPGGLRMVCTLRKENLHDTFHNSHSRNRNRRNNN